MCHGTFTGKKLLRKGHKWAVHYQRKKNEGKASPQEATIAKLQCLGIVFPIPQLSIEPVYRAPNHPEQVRSELKGMLNKQSHWESHMSFERF